MNIHFILLCEGPSDRAIVQHLKLLLVDCGAKVVTGNAPDFRQLPQKVSRDISTKVSFILQNENDVDLLFIHRDSDSPDAKPRYTEIKAGVAQAGYNKEWIGVVPVRTIEAWLLLDELAIRRISGCLRGRVRLSLPTPSRVEAIAKPKEMLKNSIVRASELTGRKLCRLKRNLPVLREKLLTELKPNGPLLGVSSWQRLKCDVKSYINGQLN